MGKEYEDIGESFWVHQEKGDSVNGIFIGTKEKIGKNKQDAFMLKQENGDVKLVWSSVVLSDKMKLVALGEDIRIIYEGLKKPENGKEYHDYRVQRATGAAPMIPAQ